MLIEGTCLGLVDRLFFLYCSENYRDLHSFPTRRSSDLYWMSAIRLDRLGSYSMRTTEAATPSFLFRLKSIRRYIFLCPPPRNRTVMTPWLFRPPFFLRGTKRDFSGLFSRGSVHSAKSLTDP